jgi:hypothetical protein
MEEKNIGDKVWWAVTEHRQTKVVCPICFGERIVTLILGNGEEVKTECEYCKIGFESARGFTMEYERFSDVKEIIITGKEVTENSDGKKIEYRSNTDGHNYCLYPNDNIFNTKEEAEFRVKQMIKSWEDDEVKRIAHKKKSNQTHLSWSVGYYKKKLKDAKKDVEYYSNKLLLIKPHHRGIN